MFALIFKSTRTPPAAEHWLRLFLTFGVLVPGIFLVMYGSVILVSKGCSFARWDQWHSVEYFVNHHAQLFVHAGAGLFGAFAATLILTALNYRLEQRVRELEDRIKRLERPKEP